MKRFAWVPICLLFLLLTGPASPPTDVAVADSAAPSAAVALVAVEPGSLTIELQVPDLAPQSATDEGLPCIEWTAPGLSPLARSGKPLLPTRGVWLAVPTLTNLRLEVLEAAAQPLPAFPLCPTPEPAPVWQGDDSGSLYPGPLAEIRSGGIVRGQPVAQVQFYPVQVDSARRQVWFYPRLRVRLTFDPGAATTRPARTAGGPFESLLRALLLNEPSAVQTAPVDEARRPETQPPSAALKLFVEHDGLVQVTPADLAAAGWDPSTLVTGTLKLSLQGAELPIWVEDQDGDGLFDDDDLMLFYGQAASGPYTRRNVYWLTADGAPGRRMGTRDVSPVHGYGVPTSFPATLHAEEDVPGGYWQNPPGKEAQDHWYWTGRLSAPASANLFFQMPPFDTTAVSATLRVLLAGYTDDVLDPDHHTRLRLNGTLVDDAWWNGWIQFQHTVAFSPTLLVVGNNTLTVQSVGDTGATVDGLYANWLEVDYQALYIAQGDRLVFGAPGEGDYRFQVSGLSSSDVEALDLTDPSAPVRLTGVQSQPTDAAYTAILEDHAGPSARYLIQTTAQRRSPDGIIADRPSDLHSPANGADEIIIAYDGVYTDTLPLADHRQAQGLRVQVVRLTDVYDEFSGGLVTPQAIHDFLAYAYGNWASPAPTYVLLVGDAHLDWLDRFGTGKPIYLPTYIFDAFEIGETASDTRLACVDGSDPLPDLFLGRLSARSSADVQVQVAKIMAYELQPPGDWASRALFVADDEMPIFKTAAESWIAQLPPAYQPQRVYAGDYPPGNPQNDIVAAINDGRFLVSYVGHGNQDRWGTWSGGQLFNLATVGLLTNGDRLPFVLTATCLNGFFVNPLVDYCLAEELARKSGGGAVGVWSPTALGVTAEHQVLFGQLFTNLFAAEAPTLGSVTTQAKLAAYGQGVSQELIETFTLFGDPATPLRVTSLYRVHLPLAIKGQ